MTNAEIVEMSVVEYCDLLVAMAEFNGHNDPHKTNWDYCHWHGVVSEEMYELAESELLVRSYCEALERERPERG